MKIIHQSTLNNRSLVSRCLRPAGGAFTPFLVILILAACRNQSMPPGGHSIGGSFDGRAGYLMVYWPEGLRVMIWDDLPHGGHFSGSSSSTSDPVFHMDGGAQGEDGRSYQYILESTDGVEGVFSIDDTAYDLNQGKLFLIRTESGKTLVEQLNIDISGVATSNAGLEAFGEYLPELIAFTGGSKTALIPTSTGTTAPGTTNGTIVTRMAETAGSPQPTISSHFPTTGLPVLDRTVAVILGNDYGNRRELINFSTAGCVNMTTLGGPPKCAAGMDEGTPLDFFPVRLVPGETFSLLAGDIAESLNFETTELFAAYRQNPATGQEDRALGSEYGLIFLTDKHDGWILFHLFHTDRGGQIVQMDVLGCPVESLGQVSNSDYVKCSPELIVERDAVEVLVRPDYTSIAPAADIEPSEPLQTVPPRWTPTPTPVSSGSSAPISRPLYFLTGELPISSIFGDDHGLWVLEPGSPSARRVTPADQHVTAVDIEGVDGRIAYGTGDGAIYVIETDGQARSIYTHPQSGQGQKATIGSVSWSPDREWLAFTAAYRDEEMDSAAGGLWLLGFEDNTTIKLLANSNRAAGDNDVSHYRSIMDVDYSPDGSALLLRGSFWEYADMLWMLPLGVDPEENNLTDPAGIWRDGSWTLDGRSILLSGWDRAMFSDLATAHVESGKLTVLVDGEAAGLLIANAQEVPQGIVFVGMQDDLDGNTAQVQLYLGQQTAGGFSYETLPGADRELCQGGYFTGIVWNSNGREAVVSCHNGAELISLDSHINIDLRPFLEPLPDGKSLEVFWGP